MIGSIISAFFMIPIVFYIWNDWSENKFKWKDKKTIFIVLLSSVATLLNYYNINSFFKIFTMTLLFILAYKFLFNTRFKKSVAGPVIIQVMYLISESIFTVIILMFMKSGINDFIENFFGKLISNLSISIIVLILYKIKIFKKIFIEIDKKVSKIDEITTIFMGISVIYFYSIFAFNIYYKSTPELLLILSAVISVLTFVMFYLFIKSRYDYYKISNNYNNSLLSLTELENALTNHRIDNHENRNHLMTIRNMTKNKKIINFIDSIANNKLEDDKRIMKETSIIPEGGLRGLIYSKILLMVNKNIDYELDISNSVRTVDILDFGDETILDVCKVIGIFLDNAIEEVDTIDDKYIIIEMYKENDIFTIIITNTYDNKISKKDIYKAGVSTKGGNHGYGLSLAKKIIKKNSKLESHNEITETEFTQILNIKK